MKNKTIKLVSLLVIMIVLTSQAVFAASEKPYTVELKNGFEEVADGIYVSDENGNVWISETDPSEKEKNEEYFYSNQCLEEVEKDAISTAKEIAKEMLKINLEDEYSEEEIEQMVDLIKIEIKKKEISTFTKNNYKCVHFVINFSVEDKTTLVLDIYGTLKNEKIYTLISYTEPEKDSAAKSLINSFTFVETEEPKTEEPKSEEVKEDSKTEEPKSEEVKEEPKAEENKSEVKEETKQEEAKSEVKEETKKEETKTETKDTTVKEGKLPQTGVAVSFETIAISILSLGTALFVINNKRK